MADKARERREPLVGYMIFEQYCEDYSDWSGMITGPDDPTGANLAWENPIKMIEYSALEAVQAERDEARDMVRELVNTLDYVGRYPAAANLWPEAIQKSLTKAKEWLGKGGGSDRSET